MNEVSVAGVEFREDGSVWHPDFGDLTLDVLAEVAAMEKADRVEESVARLAIARESAALGPRRNMAFGRVVAEIDAQDYDDQAALEPGCWEDKGFVQEFTKLIPESAVESRSDKIVSRVAAMPWKGAAK